MSVRVIPMSHNHTRAVSLSAKKALNPRGPILFCSSASWPQDTRTVDSFSQLLGDIRGLKCAHWLKGAADGRGALYLRLAGVGCCAAILGTNALRPSSAFWPAQEVGI
jgi:hypothetical protein